MLKVFAAPYAMIALVMVSGALVAVASPMSNTWLTDLVPQEVRGRWVARNQSIIAGVAMIAGATRANKHSLER